MERSMSRTDLFHSEVRREILFESEKHLLLASIEHILLTTESTVIEVKF